jgi:hypothetical protein
MKLENQLTSLELSKRLKELGVGQESLFYWQQGYKEMKGTEIASYFEITQTKTESKKGMRCFSAFTVAELGELLPMMIGEGYLEMSHDSYGWLIVYRTEEAHDDPKDVVPIQRDLKSEADARAKMLVYLLENDLLPAPSERG